MQQLTRKQIIIVLALILVIGASIGFTLKRQFGGPEPPDETLAQLIEKIDAETLRIVAKPLGDWQEWPVRDGKYQNPDTGKFSLVDLMKCASCGEKIPAPEEPGKGLSAMESGITTADIEAVEAAYRCPKCGGPAFAEPGMGY